jgi:hypothetical protein
MGLAPLPLEHAHALHTYQELGMGAFVGRQAPVWL